jgi:periplasmic divalent cation tolerance protein
MKDYVVALVTAPSRDVGAEIARALLERELVACVNIVPAMESFYVWEGELCRDEEVLLVIKTQAETFEDEMIAAVQDLHPYEVPEIIALPVVSGSREYLAWIDEEVSD